MEDLEGDTRQCPDSRLAQTNSRPRQTCSLDYISFNCICSRDPVKHLQILPEKQKNQLLDLVGNVE